MQEKDTPEDCILLPAHRQILTERAIPVDFAIRHGVRSIDLAEAKRKREEYSIPPPWPHLPLHPVMGLGIQYQVCLDGISRGRVRSDVTSYVQSDVEHHELDVTIEIPRYICQAGVLVAPYIIDEILASSVAGDPSIPLFMVEAPLKALCLSAHGFLAIGLGGVLAGAHAKDSLVALDEIVAHPELQRIRWNGRRVYIVFDAGLGGDDAPGNPMVALGAARVWRALSDLGADVHLVRIPYHHPQESDPEKGELWSPTDQGPDDFIARNGVEAFRRLVVAAVPADPQRRLAMETADCTPVERSVAVGRVLRELFVQATLDVADGATLGAVAAVTSRAGVGKKDLKEAASDFRERITRRLHQDDAAWLKRLKLSATGNPKPIRENVELALRHDGGLLGLVAFNEFSQAIVFDKEPPWTELYQAAKKTRVGDAWTDEDDTRLGAYLAEHFGILDVPPQKIRAAVVVMAKETTKHPVRDYLSSLVWDGIPRVEAWLAKYLGVEANDYASMAGRWWLISAVARIMDPGCQVDHILVLEGPQGRGKTSALRVLGGAWFSDADLGDLRSKEAALALQGIWLHELAEGEVFSRASIRTLKAFSTRTFDDIVPKFSNLRQRLARRCVFALTTNDEADYLADDTGNRRFLPVRVGVIDLAGLRAVRDQLWAEAVALYKGGAKWWPVTAEERALCKAQQDERQVHDVWLEPIRAGLRQLESVTLSSALGLVGVPMDRHGRREQLRVASCLRAVGWVEGPRAKHVRSWVRGPGADPLAPPAVRVVVDGGRAVVEVSLDEVTAILDDLA